MTDQERWNRALDLFIESVHKPDAELRGCAHRQECYHELLHIRQNIIDYLPSLRWHD